MVLRVAWTRKALEDLRAIKDYISSLLFKHPTYCAPRSSALWTRLPLLERRRGRRRSKGRGRRNSRKPALTAPLF